MANIRIMRLECPKKHLIAGFAYNPDSYSEEKVIALMKISLAAIKVDPWCALCLSRDLVYSPCETVYPSIAAAMPHIESEAHRQKEARLKHERTAGWN